MTISEQVVELIGMNPNPCESGRTVMVTVDVVSKPMTWATVKGLTWEQLRTGYRW